MNGRKNNLKKRDLLILFFEIFLLGLSTIVIIFTKESSSWATFILLSKFGTIMCILFSVLLCGVQKSVFNIVNLVFASFWVFQFGLPICYALIDEFSNFYINLFEISILVEGCQYSILAIEFFAISLTFSLSKSNVNLRNKVIFDRCIWTNDNKLVEHVGMVLFTITAIVEFPLMIYAAYATKTYGFFVANTRAFLSSNAIYRAVQAFFVPSGFLVLLFTNSHNRKRIILFILCIISFLQLLAGDRTNGLACLLAIAYFQVLGKNTTKKEKKKNQILFGTVLCLLMIVLVYVALARVSTTKISLKEVISEGIIVKFFAELGLNFTTICFVMDYIPSNYKYRYGFTYLSALLCIIPKSIDPTGVISYLSSFNPEMWLYNANHVRYGTLLDFGVGFSVIGESYMNFSWFGLLAVFAIGILIMKFISVDFSKCSNWGKYIQLVLLTSLMTFSRRGFYDLIKDIEYSILGISLFLWIVHSARRKRRSSI